MKKNKPNLGHINFLNCLPLTYSISRGVGVDLNVVADMPANLNRAILEGRLDISPVSSIVYAQYSDRLLLLPDVSITADGEVQSIVLVSRKSIEELDCAKIILTAKSVTSHCLLKIIMRKSYGAEPCYEVRTVNSSGIVPDDAEAMLLIGDDALVVHHNHRAGFFYYDLGCEWKKLTGMRMVYAVWVARKDFALTDTSAVKRAYDYIVDGFRYGCDHKAEAVCSSGTDFTQAQLMEYLAVIKWDFDDEHHRALLKFYEMANELDLVPYVPELAIMEVGKCD